MTMAVGSGGEEALTFEANRPTINVESGPSLPHTRVGEVLGDEHELENVSESIALPDDFLVPPRRRGARALPDELLDNIFTHFDGPAPSASDKLIHEPSFDLTCSEVVDLKSVSLVCQKWRRIVIPRLFRHARLVIPDPITPIPIFRSQGQPLFDFVRRHNMKACISSFSLCVSNEKASNHSDLDYQSNDFSTFWTKVFEALDPVDLTIISSPQVLGALTSALVSSDDAWSFDMPYHILQLRRPATTAAADPEEASPSSSKASGSASIRHSVLFEGRPWTSLLLNEGSFVKAYKTYEFFQKRPPSILPCLIESEEGQSSAMIPATIRDLSYIAIFPISTHFSKLTSNAPRLDRLYTQFVPRKDIFNDPAQMEHLDPHDLWLERNSCYAFIMRELFNNPPTGNFEFLKEFESGDSADLDAWQMAVEYVKRAGGNWRIERTGVFVKDMTKKDDARADAAGGLQPSLLSVTDNAS